MEIRDLGIIPYADALRMQERLVSEVRGGGEETLLLLEHPPVYTIGAGGSLDNVLDATISALRVNRGGDVTYHGPGQLVGYPILDLSRRGRDLHRYLRFLEQLLMQSCQRLGVETFTVSGRTGVWTGEGKLASIGVAVRQWVSMHGFALNVSVDTAAFQRINPCGMAACRITSLAVERGSDPGMAQVKELVREHFQELLEGKLPQI
jgi:lipoyl(octanoyl) transferase